MKIQKLSALALAGIFVSLICQVAFADDGDPDPGGGVQPADVCIDDSVNCTVGTSTFISKSCYNTTPSGCCQVKNYDYTCVGSTTIQHIKHQDWNSNIFGGSWHCSGLDCLP